MEEVRTKTYVGALAVFALVLTVSWVYWYGIKLEPRFLVGALVFSIIILIGDIFPIKVSGKDSIGFWDIGLVVAVTVVSPVWAALAILPSALYTGKRDPLRTLYEMAHMITLSFLAGIVFSFASDPLLTDSSVPSAQVLYGTLAAGLALLAANATIVSILLKIKYGRGFHNTWKEDVEPYLLPQALNVLTAGLSVLALVVYGPVAAIVVATGAVASQVLVYRSRHQLRENQELKERIHSLERSLTTSNLTFGAMMIQDLGRRDGYTDRHAVATSVYSADIARELQLDELRAERLGMAGLLHNIGMFSLPEEILSATGKLNSLARSELEKHPARGERALAAVPELREMASWVRWHHERLDGRGYPDKLRGSWIPTEARILAVAQAYAAMIIDQPRRPGLALAEARGRLNAGIDTEFDGVVVRAFARILDAESEGYRMADDHRFVFPKPSSDRLQEVVHDTGPAHSSLSETGEETSGPRNA